jgi:hypothetical protein
MASSFSGALSGSSDQFPNVAREYCGLITWPPAPAVPKVVVETNWAVSVTTADPAKIDE